MDGFSKKLELYLGYKVVCWPHSMGFMVTGGGALGRAMSLHQSFSGEGGPTSCRGKGGSSFPEKEVEGGRLPALRPDWRWRSKGKS